MRALPISRLLLLLSLLFVIATFSTEISAQTPRPTATPKIVEEEGVVKVESRLVVIPVAVTDAAGQPVSGLTAADFRILEEGKLQTIESVGTAEQVPLEIALLFDVSSSADPLFEFEKTAAAQFLQTVMKPDDRATIFLIGEHPVSLATSQSATQAAGTLRGIAPASKVTQTAFYDTVIAAAKYLQRSAPVRSRRVIVALTDGEDNWSSLTQRAEMATYRDVDVNTLTQEKRNELAAKSDAAHAKARSVVIKELQDADSVFYAVNPAGASFKLSKISVRAQGGMERFAAETGGTAFLPKFAPTDTKDTLQNTSNIRKNQATLDQIFRQLASELRAQYLIQYYPETDYPSGRFVKLDVGLANPSRGRVRAREGYYVKQQ
jgi:Ca-activated chloride channel family protein